MNTPVLLNISEVEQKFKEIYKDPQDSYLLPSYLLGYSAGLLSKVPDITIPGQDAHMIVAAHLGRVLCEVEKENKKFLERCTNEDNYVVVTNQPKTIKQTSVNW